MHRDTALVELPRPAAPEFQESSTVPARFERIRITIARALILRHTYVSSFAIFIAPATHPWTALAKTGRENFREMTHVALRPRGPDGITIALRDLERVDASSNRIRRWLWRVAALYLVLDVVSMHVPGPFDFTGVDETIRLFERIASSVSAG